MNPHPKKYASIATAFALILILSLSSCGGRSAGNGPSAAPSATPAAAPDASAAAVGTVSDYFPDISGKVYSYESPTEPNLNQDVVYAYTNGNRVQRLYKAGGYVMTEVLMIDAGSAALLYADAGGSFEDLTGASSDKIVVILKEPLTKGNKWRGGDGVGCEITDTLARVETPSGGYDCVEMTMTTEAGALGSVSGRTSRIYYAKGVGMVKTAYSLPDGSSYEIDLVKISENAGLTYDMTVYLPGGTGATALRPFTVTTNYDPAAALTAALRPADGGPGLIARDASVVSLRVDRAALAAAAVLTAGFAGDADAEDVLTCLGYTIGKFFNVSAVSFTVDGAQAGAKAVYDGSPPDGDPALSSAIDSAVKNALNKN